MLGIVLKLMCILVKISKTKMNWYKKTIESEKKSVIIAKMKKEFIIMRGISGSGKSTLAKQLAGETGQIFSADDFWEQSGRGYQFDPNRLGEAHNWNYDRIVSALANGVTPVILDNTNVTLWDMAQAKPVIELAQSEGYDVRIEQPSTPWAFNAEELVKRNTHGVPLKTIEKKIRQWAPDVTVDDIMNYKN